MSLYSNRVTKFLSVKCPWCCGRSLSWTRRLCWYFCDDPDFGGSRACNVWCWLFKLLRKSRSSATRPRPSAHQYRVCQVDSNDCAYTAV